MRRGRYWLAGGVLLVGLGALATVAMAQQAGEAGRWDHLDPKLTESPNVLDIVLVRGGPIVWFILLPLSVVTIALAIQQFIAIRRSVLIPPDAVMQVQALFDERRYREALDFTASDASYVSYIVHEGLSEAANGYNAMLRSMQEGADERTATLFRKIEFLNIIGAVAPMIGLFGTVWGMLQTFFNIALYASAMKSMPPPHYLAGGIFVALLTTAWGLAIAIPALGVYGINRNRVDQLSAQAQLQANELLKNFKPGARPAARPQAKPAAQPAARPATS
jgi:biopolymer transport protein ExbB